MIIPYIGLLQAGIFMAYINEQYVNITFYPKELIFYTFFQPEYLPKFSFEFPNYSDD